MYTVWCGILILSIYIALYTSTTVTTTTTSTTTTDTTTNTTSTNATTTTYRSFYSSSRFADIPIPPSEDWEAATGMVVLGVLYLLCTLLG